LVLVIARWQIRITRVPSTPTLRFTPPPPALAAQAAQERQRILETQREQVHAWMLLHGKPTP